ncbi:MAG: hypothetical protein JSV79_10545 [Armatimonadota bacterium]|nr:MAG: hypothetical protein JSV79_10545 [Armatimonadota bacterium]
MSSGEKKVAVVLVVVLIAMIGVYFSLGPKSELAGTGGAGLVGGAGAAFAEAEPMGPDDAKVKIVGLVPIANPCHAATVAALKEVYEEHPNDVQLTLIEFMGPNAMEWKQKLGVTCATVEINGSYRFELDGRNVIFQKQEGMTYRPADIKTVVEAELAKAG